MEAKECDNLIFYLVGELPDSQAIGFKNHLNNCPSCLQELEDMQDTWLCLSYDREDKEAPKSLKVEIMSHIFEEQEQTKPSLFSQLPPKIRNSLKKFATPLKIGTVIGVVLICMVGLRWGNVLQTNIGSTQKQITSQETNLINKTFILQPKNSSKAEGVVYLVNDGKQNRLIMQVNHIPQLKGKQVYQAWLLYDGKYWSCGSFKSNKSGEGVLTYLIPPKVHVEGVKITLEPKLEADQPRGQTILFTL